MSTQPHSAEIAYVRTDMLDEQPAPAMSKGIVAWLHESLFSSIPYTILTLVSIYILYVVIPPVVSFMVTNAVWSGADRAACATEAQGGMQPDGWFGACWAYVGAYANQFVYGRYPDAEQWRVNIVGILFFGGLIPLLVPSAPFKRENILFVAVVFPIAALILLTGGHFDVGSLYLPLAVLAAIMLVLAFTFARLSESDPMPSLKTVGAIFAGLFILLFILGFDFGLLHVETEIWGGLLVTLVIAVTGIAASLPLGIALALGRRSALPIVRFFLDCLHRILAWCAADHRPVHVLGDAAAFPAGRRFFRQVVARPDRRGAFLLGLYGGGCARRPAGSAEGPV